MSTHHNINREIPGEIIRLTTCADPKVPAAPPAPRDRPHPRRAAAGAATARPTWAATALAAAVAMAAAASGACDMGVRVDTAQGKGRGLFAARAFSPGETILSAPVAVVERLGLPGDVARYAFTWGRGQRAIAFGLVSLCNHHDTPNAALEPNPQARTLTLSALTPIGAGDEIVIRYPCPPGQDL